MRAKEEHDHISFTFIRFLRSAFAFSDGSVGKESACNAGDIGDACSIPLSGRFPWRMNWQPSPVFLPEKSHGQRSLVGGCLWGRTELDTTEVT